VRIIKEEKRLKPAKQNSKKRTYLIKGSLLFKNKNEMKQL
jgi:hypothetical protein